MKKKRILLSMILLFTSAFMVTLLFCGCGGGANGRLSGNGLVRVSVGFPQDENRASANTDYISRYVINIYEAPYDVSNNSADSSRIFISSGSVKVNAGVSRGGNNNYGEPVVPTTIIYYDPDNQSGVYDVTINDVPVGKKLVVVQGFNGDQEVTRFEGIVDVVSGYNQAVAATMTPVDPVSPTPDIDIAGIQSETGLQGFVECGKKLTISGSGFGNATDAGYPCEVRVGGNPPLDYISWAEDKIEIIAPYWIEDADYVTLSRGQQEVRYNYQRERSWRTGASDIREVYNFASLTPSIAGDCLAVDTERNNNLFYSFVNYDSPDYNVYASRFVPGDSVGGPNRYNSGQWLTDGRINAGSLLPGAPGDLTGPQIAFNDQGAPVNLFGSAGSGLFYSVFNGTVWVSSPGAIDGSENIKNGMVVNNKGINRIFTVYKKQLNVNESHIYSLHSADSGTGWSTAVEIDGIISLSDSNNPAAAFGKNGDGICVYFQKSPVTDIYVEATRYVASSDTWLRNQIFRVSDYIKYSSSSSAPVIAYFYDRSVTPYAEYAAVLYVEISSDNYFSLKSRIHDPSITGDFRDSWSSPYIIESATVLPVFYLQTAQDKWGNLVCVYQLGEAANAKIFYTKFIKVGNNRAWTTPQLLSSPDAASSYNPRLINDTRGNMICVFNEDRIADSGAIYGVGNFTGTWEGLQNIGNGVLKKCTFDREGNAAVLFYDNGDNTVKAIRFE